jgi:hypothetical protein
MTAIAILRTVILTILVASILRWFAVHLLLATGSIMAQDRHRCSTSAVDRCAADQSRTTIETVRWWRVVRRPGEMIRGTMTEGTMTGALTMAWEHRI